jgi:hypothetical protein
MLQYYGNNRDALAKLNHAAAVNFTAASVHRAWQRMIEFPHHLTVFQKLGYFVPQDARITTLPNYQFKEAEKATPEKDTKKKQKKRPRELHQTTLFQFFQKKSPEPRKPSTQGTATTTQGTATQKSDRAVTEVSDDDVSEEQRTVETLIQHVAEEGAMIEAVTIDCMMHHLVQLHGNEQISVVDSTWWQLQQRHGWTKPKLPPGPVATVLCHNRHFVLVTKEVRNDPKSLDFYDSAALYMPGARDALLESMRRMHDLTPPIRQYSYDQVANGCGLAVLSNFEELLSRTSGIVSTIWTRENLSRYLAERPDIFDFS